MDLYRPFCYRNVSWTGLSDVTKKKSISIMAIRLRIITVMIFLVSTFVPCITHCFPSVCAIEWYGILNIITCLWKMPSGVSLRGSLRCETLRIVSMLGQGQYILAGGAHVELLTFFLFLLSYVSWYMFNFWHLFS